LVWLFGIYGRRTVNGYNEPMYSVKEAALKMGISKRHLRLLLEKGEVEGKKLGHDWVVLSLDYKRRRKPKGGRNELETLH